ncbi:MAG: putative peptidoglycan glycosyltransferase FtsW [Candidatus Marinimicrobia bacterium]|jgi:cell division protein FtsW|nr:putative peptidoglycan glycosyltransferase FtsW [Candidatus Neomarinimicrobiota bacterium]|tara:strand:+ start:106 stop:1260 length:1155 start_codon:yes stop_codon:yes gene_type:complete
MIDMLIQRYDRHLLVYLGILTVMGTVMLYSASWYESFANSNGRTDMLFLQGHLKRMLVGVFFLFGFLTLDYRRLKDIAPYFLVGAIILLISTKAFYLMKGFSWYKPARWLYLGPFTLQTSDVARMAIIVFMAYYVDKKRDQLKDFQMGLLPALSVLAIIMGLIVIQPDYSTALMLGTIGALILFIGGAQISQLTLAGAGAMLIGIPVLISREYRRVRILSFFGLGDNPDIGYQASQSLISLGNGGIFGVGLGNSIEKNHLLPTPHTDFIFAIIGEELGFILGTVPVLTLFILIFFRGLKVAKECTDPFGVFLAVGISFNLVLYAFVNVAVVTGIFPVTGLPMPMVSYGGSGMVINMALIGILLNISQARRSVGSTRGWSPSHYG